MVTPLELPPELELLELEPPELLLELLELPPLELELEELELELEPPPEGWLLPPHAVSSAATVMAAPDRMS
jgi:hypothetical protein